MSLPQINSFPEYETKIPSTGKKVKFRPYLVKEEKILLLAMESQDIRQSLDAVANVVASCILEDINKKDLTTFDVEYLFLKIRAKSVGERSTVLMKCEECSNETEVSINLDDVEIGEVKTPPRVKITDEVQLKMKYPTYDEVSHNEKVLSNASSTEAAFSIVASCIESIMTEEEVYKISEHTEEEVQAFLESLTSAQYLKISEFVDDLPRLKHTVEFNCSSCEKHNTVELQGINDFF